MVFYNSVEEVGGDNGGRVSGLVGTEMYHLRQAINKDEKGVMTK